MNHSETNDREYLLS